MMNQSLNKNMLMHAVMDMEKMTPQENWLNFSQIETVSLLPNILNQPSEHSLKYSRNLPNVPLASEASWVDSCVAAEKSEKHLINMVEPVQFSPASTSELRVSEINPDNLASGEVGGWLQISNAWWHELSSDMQDYLVKQYGEPLLVPQTSFGIYSDEVSMGQCYDAENYLALAENRDLTELNNMVFESEHEHSVGAFGATNRLLVAEWGGIVLPWTFYEPSSVTKIRLKNILLAQRFSGENITTKSFTHGSGSILWLKMGRVAGQDWRLRLDQGREQLMKKKVNSVLSQS